VIQKETTATATKGLHILYSLLFSLLAFLPYFVPPANWEATKPAALSEYVQIGFVGKASSEFRPSLNFATEEVDVSLKQYVKAVKKMHSTEPQTTWRDLGKFKMQAGEGRLTEITSPSAWGQIKILQLLFVEGNTAYILTGAALKNEFAKFQNDFMDTFRSLSLIPDIFSPLSEKKRAPFEALWTASHEHKDQDWKDLQQAAASCPEMGTYWQFVVLKEGYSKIFQKEKVSLNAESSQ